MKGMSKKKWNKKQWNLSQEIRINKKKQNWLCKIKHDSRRQVIIKSNYLKAFVFEFAIQKVKDI